MRLINYSNIVLGNYQSYNYKFTLNEAIHSLLNDISEISDFNDITISSYDLKNLKIQIIENKRDEKLKLNHNYILKFKDYYKPVFKKTHGGKFFNSDKTKENLKKLITKKSKNINETKIKHLDKNIAYKVLLNYSIKNEYKQDFSDSKKIDKELQIFFN